MKADAAQKLFREGANCAQAVLGAYCTECGLSSEQALRLASSFGAGMGRLREVCGAVAAMFMVSGLIEGSEEIGSKALKDKQYKRVQALAKAFKEQTGSLICRELLNLPPGPDAPVSEPRTDTYYQRRPCEELVGLAARILEEHLNRTHTKGEASHEQGHT